MLDQVAFEPQYRIERRIRAVEVAEVTMLGGSYVVVAPDVVVPHALVVVAEHQLLSLKVLTAVLALKMLAHEGSHDLVPMEAHSTLGLFVRPSKANQSFSVVVVAQKYRCRALEIVVVPHF